MEQFLESLDMTNLKTMIENDSDYGDEDGDLEAGAELISCSAASLISQSA